LRRQPAEAALKSAVEMESEQDFGAENKEPRLVERSLDPPFQRLGNQPPE
jgi:hypothetical protein